jgi:hypothetical protein
MGDEKSIVESVKPSEKALKDQVTELAGKEIDIHHVEGGDPNFVYRWLNTQKQNLETKKIRGWEVDSSGKVKTLSGSEDSTHRVGDLILARMPKEKYEKMMREKKELGEGRRKIIKDRFREEGRLAGVKTFDERE